MREDSLILKYRKAMKQKSNATIEEKNKIRSNYVTKLFLRIFLSSLLLLLLILGNNYAVKNDKISFGKKTIEKILISLRLPTFLIVYLEILFPLMVETMF